MEGASAVVKMEGIYACRWMPITPKDREMRSSHVCGVWVIRFDSRSDDIQSILLESQRGQIDATENRFDDCVYLSARDSRIIDPVSGVISSKKIKSRVGFHLIRANSQFDLPLILSVLTSLELLSIAGDPAGEDLSNFNSTLIDCR
jgi:hypothetical protein